MQHSALTKLPAPPPREGWVELAHSSRWHFVQRSRALCGLMYLGPGPFIWHTPDRACGACALKAMEQYGIRV